MTNVVSLPIANWDQQCSAADQERALCALEQGSVLFFPQLRFPMEEVEGRRSAYDHFMLQLHDRMTADPDYQSEADQIVFEFHAGSTWIAFTDQVSHAAMRGQYALEQSFCLPVTCMLDPSRAPLRILQRLAGRELV